jgi:hypothetical protein
VKKPVRPLLLAFDAFFFEKDPIFCAEKAFKAKRRGLSGFLRGFFGFLRVFLA